MRSVTTRILPSLLGTLALLLAACGDDSDATELETPAGDEPQEEAGPAEDATDEAATEPDPEADEEAGDAGDAAVPAGAGTAVVTIGDERYETNELRCPDSISGVEFFGEAQGPRDNARIHGRFGSSLPELIAVSFARGDEGEWAAVAENNVLDRGVLEDYTFDEDALSFSGTATFIWVEGAGLQDPDSLTDGAFEVACG